MRKLETPPDGRLLSLVIEGSAESVVAFDRRLRPVFSNARARRFLDKHDLPEEIHALARRILDGIAKRDLARTSPGLICFPREIAGKRFLFRFGSADGPDPLVFVYFTEETVSDRFDLNLAREQYQLTRREVDVLRHLLDGRGNLEIAERLGIAAQTVKEYVSCLYDKVGVRDRFSLLRHLISAPPPPA